MMKLLTLFFTFFLLTSSTLQAYEENIIENTTLVKAGNKFITLLGEQINVGDIAPDFTVVDEKFSRVNLYDFKNKNILISVVPSIDTGVCSIQTKTFNNKVGTFSKNTIFITMSNDLPFAQKRYCTNEKVSEIKLLSDAVWRDFGTKYGLTIKDMGLLTRAILLIDTNKKVIYKELVSNISDEPDYKEAFKQIKLLNKG